MLHMGTFSHRLQKLPNSVQIALAAIIFIIGFLIVGMYADHQIHDDKGGIVNTNQPANNAVEGESRLDHAILRWDSNHYTAIVENGYQANNAAFFPLYPVLVKAVTSLGISTSFSLLMVSWLFAILASIVLFYWVRFELRERKVKISPWVTLGLVAVFPTSLFLATGYTESLFLFLVVSALYAYRTKHYLLAGVFVALSTATRVPGGALAVFFLVDYLLAKRWSDWKKLVPVVMAPLGLIAYMIFLWHAFGNPFQFIEAQHDWGRLDGNPVENLVSSFTPVYLWFLPVLAAGLWLVYHYLGLTWLIYSLVFIAIPLLSGRFDSLNRYMLTLPPLFLAFTLYSAHAPKWLKLIFIASSAFLLAWGVILFTNGYWVA